MNPTDPTQPQAAPTPPSAAAPVPTPEPTPAPMPASVAPTPSPAPMPTPAPAPVPPAAAPVYGTVEEPHGWNWGAFFLTWIWGIGNKVWISFLSFLPVVGFIMIFVLGAKGTKWAWEADQTKDLAAFKARQHKWAVWGTWIFIISILIGIGGAIAAVALTTAVLTQESAVATDFTNDLAKGDYAAAYQLTSSTVQQSITESYFEASYAGAKESLNGCTPKTSNPSSDTLNGKTTGNVTVTCASYTFTTSLVKESGHWKVSDFKSAS